MGVKSLWDLVKPVGRPVMLETIEGKSMAIDSSIWIYQFQATMRDKDGRALSNAHVLGFLRRISKLLFYGIKPVFVFDGGAPALKRATINERRRKKSGAVASHAKLAEKLLAAQMRREALNHTSQFVRSAAQTSKAKPKAPAGPALIDEDAVYLEDVDPSMPKTPAKRKAPNSTSTSSKKNKFHDHDPYRLPDVDLEEAVAKATRAVAPDPRLATEDELRAFIEDMRPEDFDVTSPAFRELPTEVQYEIVGDLRLKSRQTSYKRLQSMLNSAPTPLDFSKQQIKNLKQRNSLTQQLLMTTDSIGKAHISIPVRIASERNKEYVLMKNDGEAGGWILGIRDNGTQQKPIEIDQDSDKDGDDDSDVEMEEVQISREAAPDTDLREYQREMALSAIANRHTQKKLTHTTTKPIQRKSKAKPLFDLDEGEVVERLTADNSGDEDEGLAFAIQESLDDVKITKAASNVHHPLLLTKSPSGINAQASSSSSMFVHTPTQSLNPSHSSSSSVSTRRSSDKDISTSSTRLETALSIANAGPSRISLPQSHGSAFGQPVLLTSSSPYFHSDPIVMSDSEENLEEIEPQQTVPKPMAPLSPPFPLLSGLQPLGPPSAGMEATPDSDDDDDMEEIMVSGQKSPIFQGHQSDILSNQELDEPVVPADTVDGGYMILHSAFDHHLGQDTPFEVSDFNKSDAEAGPSYSSKQPSLIQGDNDEEALTEWSRSPSPMAGPSRNVGTSRPSSPAVESWDAAQEMDPRAEEGEFARFLSQVKGKDVEDVRREIDDEIKSLNQQKKTAMRDSEDITQQMISQIMMMLRLFGIPYITAPMEAEAQCAELVSLGLVDGIITDDSDVFLFGGRRVFKNMFNQSKTVECFLLSDLGRELGLDRDALIRLAYLLGSDYVDGLPGVGPVVAMELLKEFPGENGLHKFKDWWLRVQSGKDKENDNKSKFRKRFKNKFKDLYLPNEWPNPAVRDAYYHPTVDDSDEPFKWGLPDLDALRQLLHEELGWHQGKADDLLLPIIRKMGKRGQVAALNKQGNLNEFFDVMAGNGAIAPRKRQPYASKRLQKVVSDFRSKRKDDSSSHASDQNEGFGSELEEEAPVKKKKKTKTSGSAKSKRILHSENVVKRGKDSRRGNAASSMGKESSSEGDEFKGVRGERVVGTPPPLQVQLRPRPKPAYKGA